MVDTTGVTRPSQTPTTTPAYLPPVQPAGTGGTHLTPSQVEDEAKRILDVGSQFGTDDYDARLDEYARVVSTLDAPSAAALHAEFFDGDGVGDDAGAHGSWLQGDRLLSLKDEGRVSYSEAQATVEAFGDAYQAGAYDHPTEAMSFIDPGATQMAPGWNPETFNRGRELLNLGSDLHMNGFREQFAGDLLRTYVTDNQNPGRPGLEAGYAMTIVADGSDPTMAARIYGGFDAADRAKVLTALAEDGVGYVNSQGAVPGLPDPVATLLNSVASQPSWTRTATGETWGAIATELVRAAPTTQTGSHGDSLLFQGGDGPDAAIPARVEAMSRLFANHSVPILDAMTDGRNSNLVGTPGDAGSDATLAGKDGIALGTLFRATLLNENNPEQGRVRSALMGYVGQQRDAAAAGDSQAISRLGYIGAAATDAVTQLGLDLKGDADARKALVNFAVDLALAAVPAGGAASGAVKKALTDMFGEGVMAQVVSRTGGALVDKATGRMTEEARTALNDALGRDDAALTASAGGANWVLNALYQGAEAGGYYDRLASSILTGQEQIDEARE